MPVLLSKDDRLRASITEGVEQGNWDYVESAVAMMKTLKSRENAKDRELEAALLLHASAKRFELILMELKFRGWHGRAGELLILFAGELPIHRRPLGFSLRPLKFHPGQQRFDPVQAILGVLWKIRGQLRKAIDSAIQHRGRRRWLPRSDTCFPISTPK